MGSIEFEEIENDSSQGSEVLGGIPYIGWVVVFAECGVQDPVTGVLDAQCYRMGL